MDRQMVDGWTDRQMERRTDRWIGRRMDGQVDGQMDRRMDGYMTDGQMTQWTDVQTEEPMERCTYRYEFSWWHPESCSLNLTDRWRKESKILPLINSKFIPELGSSFGHNLQRKPSEKEGRSTWRRGKRWEMAEEGLYLSFITPANRSSLISNPSNEKK